MLLWYDGNAFTANIYKNIGKTIYVQLITAALALRSRGLVIGSREKEEKEREEKEREEKEEEEKNLQIAIRCLWDLFD